MSFNDLADVHEEQTKTDHQILKMFWCPENDHTTIGELKSTLRKTYVRHGILPILEDCERRHKD